MENTDLITPVYQIDLLNDHDSQQISIESNSENFDVTRIQSNKNKRNSYQNQSSSIDGSKRTKRPSLLFQDHYALNTSLENLENDPKNFSKAISKVDSDRWLEAFRDELESINKNNVWELMKLPKGRKDIGCRWVLKRKSKIDGSLERYKARLEAKWYT